jgi:hypothetical protein
MARYDKYDPKSGGFRAEIGFAAVTADLNKIFGVGPNASGRMIKGGGQSLAGVLVLTKTKAIGEVVDVMTHGEIVEATLSDGTTVIAAGVKVYADTTTGLLGVAAGIGKKPIGYTIEGGSAMNTRLVVRVGAEATQTV